MENEDKKCEISKPVKPADLNENDEYQMYCWEFQEALLRYSKCEEDLGNWFGRVVAFRSQFKITNGSFYDDFGREEFNNLITDGNLVVTGITTDFMGITFVPDDSSNKCEFQPGKIYSKADVVGRLNAVQLNGKFDIVHSVKPAFQTNVTEFKKL